MSFSLDVKRFAEKAKRNPETVIRNVAIKLFSSIITSSPVDTGRFRMNWQISNATPVSGLVSGVDRSGSAAINRVTSYAISSPTWTQFTLTNNLPYAQVLEYGSSKQAPAGMVRVNVARFNSLLSAEAAKLK
jgi:hypothetical protein